LGFHGDAFLMCDRNCIIGKSRLFYCSFFTYNRKSQDEFTALGATGLYPDPCLVRPHFP
jgi:hypothetical protein